MPLRSAATTVEPTRTRSRRSPAGSRSRRRHARAAAARGSPSIAEPCRDERVGHLAEARRRGAHVDLLPVREPGARRRERQVEAGGCAERPAALVDSSSRSVSRYEAFAPAFGGMNIDRSYAPSTGSTETASPEMYVPARHPGGEHAVEAEDELVGLVVVGEEPRDAEAVDLSEPGAGRCRRRRCARRYAARRGAARRARSR